jgi:hypothetical protein
LWMALAVKVLNVGLIVSINNRAFTAVCCMP